MHRKELAFAWCTTVEAALFLGKMRVWAIKNVIGNGSSFKQDWVQHGIESESYVMSPLRKQCGLLRKPRSSSPHDPSLPSEWCAVTCNDLKAVFCILYLSSRSDKHLLSLYWSLLRLILLRWRLSPEPWNRNPSMVLCPPGGHLYLKSNRTLCIPDPK